MIKIVGKFVGTAALALTMAMAAPAATQAATGTVGYHTHSKAICFDGFVGIYTPTIYAANVTNARDVQQVAWRAHLWKWAYDSSQQVYRWTLVTSSTWSIYSQDDRGDTMFVDPTFGAIQWSITTAGAYAVSIDYHWYSTAHAASGADSLWAVHHTGGDLHVVGYCSYS